MRKGFDLENRLILFGAAVIEIAEGLPKTFAAGHLGGQLIRSGTAPALQYGEAQAAESMSDFIHKMKIALKELRETHICLRLIRQKNWIAEGRMISLIDENNQLVAIFVKSLATAQNNKHEPRRA